MKRLVRIEPFQASAIVLTSGDRTTISSPWSLGIGDKKFWTVELIKTGTFWIRKSQIVGVGIGEPAVQTLE